MSERDGGAAPDHHVRVAIYIAAVWALTVALGVVAWFTAGPPEDLVALVVLALLAAITHSVREPDVGRGLYFSFLTIVILTSVVLLGPLGCGVIAGCAVLFDPEPMPRRKRVFNTAMTALYAMLGGFAYELLGPADLSDVDGALALLVQVGLPLTVADIVQCVANAALLGGVVALDTGASFRQVTVGMLTRSGLAYVGYDLIGFLWVILWGPAGLGPFSAILIIPPIYVAKWAFRQFGDEELAHRRTLEALVSAVEAGDPYAVGHGERIARLAEWTGEALGLGPSQANALRFAAMLHDIGRITAPAPDHADGGMGDELGVVARHPERGAELVGEIGFLRDSAEAIRHHHERYDGRGYPSGLRGPRIPLLARIIAAADAFDALTTSRPGRSALTVEQARAELQARAGTQLDPTVVSALERALDRHGWESMPATAVVAGSFAESAFDHDDPRVSDEIAELLEASRSLADGSR